LIHNFVLLALCTHPDSQSTIGGETSGNIAVSMMELVI
jgi:hypothetical protein